ncbi:MAG: hybrid sensor histidine kinase/response regulator [bacterium]|nr:hybrid sensor histidine kinase/response regulator [bacterium]
MTNNRTILYIEDDAASRSLVERTLKFHGYHVLVADCGLAGIDLARKETPDLILTDINLPDLTGREITTRLRSDPQFEHTPIVALTAQSLGEQRELALAAGLTGYLTKPLDIEALPTQVDFFLKGGSEKLDQQKLSEAQTRYTREVAERLETRIRELEALNQQLRRLDRMKDTFIQITAHELRTPLTLVFGYSRLLEDNPMLKPHFMGDANLRLLMDGMNQSIGRMQSIIGEIVTMSRIMTNQIDLVVGPTDLGNIAAKAIKSYETALKERSLKVAFDRATFPNGMRADWELIELALKNLISNAIKYTPDGGLIEITSKTEGEQVRVSVRDHGIGISKDDQRGIFERFHTTGDTQLHSTSKTAFRGGGIGLGLAITKGIVEAHGGRIWVESDGYDPAALPGSAFIFTIPLIAERS